MRRDSFEIDGEVLDFETRDQVKTSGGMRDFKKYFWDPHCTNVVAITEAR